MRFPTNRRRGCAVFRFDLRNFFGFLIRAEKSRAPIKARSTHNDCRPFPGGNLIVLNVAPQRNS